MAAMDAEAAAAEVAASLTMEEIPMKLRCSVCSLLAVGAVRMPCCDQNICENCLASLDKECPVCLHANVDRDLIKPNKTLRTTIKAFLKKKVMERDNLRKREEAARTSTATAVVTPTIEETSKDASNQSKPENAEFLVNGDAEAKSAAEDVPKTSSLGPPEATDKEGHQTSSDAQMDIPRPSIENSSDNAQMSSHQASDNNGEEKQTEGRRNSGASEQNTANGKPQAPNGQWSSTGGTGVAMPNGALGMNGALPMDFGQMMPYMMNGMPPNNLMGAFPNMMGMPAMGMDPMAMTQAMTQSMYGGFGGPGMGVNGMNMGMGFNAGQGAFGGYNGQLDTWTAGQDNYNANAYGANGMGGNFGTHAGHGGYNVSSHQGNFNQMHHQQYPNNDFQHGYNNRGYQNRGRGRRGYYNAGRGQGCYGAMNQGNHNDHTNYEPFHHQLPAQTLQQGLTEQANGENQQQKGIQGDETSADAQVDQTTDATTTEKTDEERMNKELNPGDENDDPATDVVPPSEDANAKQDSKEPEAATEHLTTANEPTKEADAEKEPSEDKPLPIETFISSDDARMGKSRMQDPQMMSMPPPVGPGIPQGPATRYSQEPSQDQGGWGRGTGRGFYRGRGEYRGRGAGYIPHVNGIHSSPTSSSPITNIPAVSPIEPKGLGVEGAPTGPKALREGLSKTGLRGGRGFSIVGRAYVSKHERTDDRPRSRSPSAIRHRTRSRSPESSQHRSSHQRSRRHRSRSESDDGERERRKERRHRRSHKYQDEENGDQEESRHRDASVESTSRKSTHRSHRHHHDKESGSSSHRHHRDRSRERDRDEERRHRKRRSRSPASIVQTPTSMTAPEYSNGVDKEDSKKRRDRDRDDDDRHRDRDRERKRSRRDRSTSPQEDTRVSHKARDRDDKNDAKSHSDSRHDSVIENHVEKAPAAKAIPTGPREPEKDHHTLEREARNRERLMKEMQRRAATEGKGLKRKNSGLDARVGGRKLSYKYEDEEGEEARAVRVEKEREAARWG